MRNRIPLSLMMLLAGILLFGCTNNDIPRLAGAGQPTLVFIYTDG